MGQEISGTRFKKRDFSQFAARLTEETGLLASWFRTDSLSRVHGVGGYELEAWLVDRYGAPAPINERYLKLLDDQLVSPELSQFNIELNSTPRRVSGDALARFQQEMSWNWDRCRQVAAQLDADLVMIGILPTVTDKMLTVAYMSQMERYRALNEQVLRLRGGRPLQLDIHGEQVLRSSHTDVMLEAATTSFQIHLQVAQEKAVRYYNAMQIISAPMVALSANSPLMFGHRLWQETRIPVFEQAVDIGGFDGAAFGPLKRVSFGSGYVRESLLEVFTENLEHFPVLLPVELDPEPERLSHLRLHNGTIWRWNRPLVGFDGDGTPHLRIEHRVIPSGPSVIDNMANTAFFFGLTHMLAEQQVAPETQLPFSVARDNFYAAAKYGLSANVTWLSGRSGKMTELLEQLIPLAREGLNRLGCDQTDIERYSSVLQNRVASGQTGSIWQLKHLERNGGDLCELVSAYRENQQSGRPVSAWPV